MNTADLFRLLEIDPANYDDLHVCRMLHAFVAVSNGRVIKITDPLLQYCPLVAYLYHQGGGAEDRHQLKEMIAQMTHEKIDEFGHFTGRRQLLRTDIAVPFGASEMMMTALRKHTIDCAVTVCDGAGTVVSAQPELVQGIGARMNGLFYTSPIRATIDRLEHLGAHVVFPDTAAIDQLAGVRKAIELGYKNIAVTVNGYLGEPLAEFRELERRLGVALTVIVVCTTGAVRSRVEEIRDHADLVWSCASAGVREIVGSRSIVQVSTAIPVFAITPAGLRFLAAYQADTSPNPGFIAALDPGKQYLVAGNAPGTPIRMGKLDTFIAESPLPVRSKSEPRPLTE